MTTIPRLKEIKLVLEHQPPHSNGGKKNILAIGCNQPEFLANYFPHNITFEHHLKSVCNIAKITGLHTTIKATGSFHAVIVTISRSKEETYGRIFQAMNLAKEGALIFVEGPKAYGISSILRRLNEILTLKHRISRSHGKIGIFTKKSKIPYEISNWECYQFYKKNLDGYFSIPGSFSQDKIDPGSKILGDLFQGALFGNVADLGSGWGYLSSRALRDSPMIKKITLFENHHGSLACSTANIKSKKAKFKWTDISTEKSFRNKFDSVICNPPFHSEGKKNTDLGLIFFRKSSEILKSSGKLWLVANLHLPYEKSLMQFFKKVDIIFTNKFFKVFLTEKPKLDK